VVFFGTPEFAVASLEALLAAGIDVAAVVTQPDRPRTRSHSTLVPSPVKQRAAAAGIPVLQPDRPRGDDFLRQVRELRADLGIVVAYGHLLRQELLDIPRLGMVNVHASLLPRWRGAAPIHWTLLAGDRVTGVSIMRMEAGLDAGPVWHQVETAVGDDETTGSLFARLAVLGGAALVAALPGIAAGAQPTPQDAARVTHAPKVDRATARIDWTRSAVEVSRLLRAMDPAPGAWTLWHDTPVKLFGPLRPHGQAGDPALAPAGTIARLRDGLGVACADDWLTVRTVQPAGRPKMPGDTWLTGHRDAVDTRFS